MYSDLPPLRHWSTRISLSAGWLCVVLMGVTSRTDPPTTINAVQPEWMSWTWAILTVVGGMIALTGAVRADYWAEAVGSWFAAAGVSGYTLTVWSLVWSGEFTRATQAWSVTALTILMITRALVLGNHAYKVRRDQQKLGMGE